MPQFDLSRARPGGPGEPTGRARVLECRLASAARRAAHPTMNILGNLTVLPHLPVRIERLDELAHNLYWTWEPAARRLFRSLDKHVWETSNHNPVVLLRDVSQERLEAAAVDPEYLGAFDRVMVGFDEYMARPGWFQAEVGEERDLYAYFCAEYGWHESIALYSGGLGVLAGDHTKAASDLGVPFVGVGLFYTEGYFHQRIDAEGGQEAVYVRHSPAEMPLTRALDEAGNAVTARVNVFGREVVVGAWKIQVGKVPVYLLDVDLPENHPDDRHLLRRLYGGDQRTRISQEILLGIAGVRMLRALGIRPTAWHMNEGHSAFMVLERARELVSTGLGFDEAREDVAANTVFTVHTPVAAGNDAFPFELIHQCFSGFWGSLGLRQQEFYELGRADHGWGSVFSMPALALRFSSGRNGVARLHGDTSRRIWSDLWPEVPLSEIPISHVTNGVHLSTWMAPELRALVGTVLPADWTKRVDDVSMWEAVHGLDDAEFLGVRRALKEESVRFLRARVLRQLDRQGASPTALKATNELFDPRALTIGFARRFATYKRATLIFRDLDRLERILTDPERPVQLVFAGKAHPADQEGQALIRHIHELSKEPRFLGRVLFVEDYDMAIGRALVRGVDVWLNNPRRPLEASGTSGEKAGMNGVLNLSILDGWWPEGFDGGNGWAIGGERDYGDEALADAADADSLYSILEREIVPLYYDDRGEDGIPHAWLRRSKQAIAGLAPVFNAMRMVRDYVRTYYEPASRRAAVMAADDHAAAVGLAAWRKDLRERWPSVSFEAMPVVDKVLSVGDSVEVEAVLNARGLSEADLRVEVVYGLAEDDLQHAIERVVMERVETLEDGSSIYRARVQPAISGRLVYGVRVYAVNPLLASDFDTFAIRWA